MSPTQSFPMFSTLPAELRIIIWEHAFSSTSHIAAVQTESHAVHNDPRISYMYFHAHRFGVKAYWRLKDSGQAAPPYQIGLTCKEAWAVLEDLFVLAPGSSLAFPSMKCWYNVERIVFNIPFDVNPTDILVCLGPQLPRKIKYITLTWNTIQILGDERQFQDLIDTCPNLLAIFIQPNSKSLLSTEGSLQLTLDSCLTVLNKQISSVISQEVARQMQHLRFLLIRTENDAPQDIPLVFIYPASHLEHEGD